MQNTLSSLTVIRALLLLALHPIQAFRWFAVCEKMKYSSSTAFFLLGTASVLVLGLAAVALQIGHVVPKVLFTSFFLFCYAGFGIMTVGKILAVKSTFRTR